MNEELETAVDKEEEVKPKKKGLSQVARELAEKINKD